MRIIDIGYYFSDNRELKLINCTSEYWEFKKEFPHGVKCEDGDIEKPVPMIPKTPTAIDESGEEYEVRLVKELDLDVTSWVGTCMEAVHYYGRLSGGFSINTNIVAYAFPHLQDFDIKLTRKCESKDIELDPDRFNLAYRTTCFWKKQDVIERAIEVVKTLFPGYQLKFENEVIYPRSTRNIRE